MVGSVWSPEIHLGRGSAKKAPSLITPHLQGQSLVGVRQKQLGRGKAPPRRPGNSASSRARFDLPQGKEHGASLLPPLVQGRSLLCRAGAGAVVPPESIACLSPLRALAQLGWRRGGAQFGNSTTAVLGYRPPKTAAPTHGEPVLEGAAGGGGSRCCSIPYCISRILQI